MFSFRFSFFCSKNGKTSQNFQLPAFGFSAAWPKISNFTGFKCCWPHQGFLFHKDGQIEEAVFPIWHFPLWNEETIVVAHPPWLKDQLIWVHWNGSWRVFIIIEIGWNNSIHTLLFSTIKTLLPNFYDMTSFFFIMYFCGEVIPYTFYSKNFRKLKKKFFSLGNFVNGICGGPS